jgi:alpha-ketoglutarate-dependent taurine dioxygenase
MQIRNLDAVLGAEILGIELAAPLVKAEIDAVETAWRERLVVVFHGQRLSDPQLMAFSRNFGELDPPGPNPYGEPFNKSHPEVNIISNVVENGKPIGSLGDGEAVWHSDMTYIDVPPKAAVLHALEVPPPEAGGNTYFANMFAAYETLPGQLKKAAEGKVAVHDASRNSAGHLPRATRRSPTFARPSARITRWSAPNPAPAARRFSLAGGRTPMSSASISPRAKRCSMRFGRMRRSRALPCVIAGRSATF